MFKITSPILKLAFFSAILITTVFLLKLKELPPQIPLFYSRPEGEKQLTDLFVIFLLPIFSYTFVFLNNYFFKKYFEDNQLVERLIFFVNLFIITLTTIIFLRIIFLIG